MLRRPTESWPLSSEDATSAAPIPNPGAARSRIVPALDTDQRIIVPDGFDGSDPPHTSKELTQGYRRL